MSITNLKTSNYDVLLQIEKLQKENKELEVVLDMYGEENYDKRYADLRLLSGGCV